MSGCHTPGCEAVKTFVEEWAKLYQRDVSYIVGEEQATTDVFIWVTSIPKSDQLVLPGQQKKTKVDFATQNRIKDFLYGKKIFKALFDAVKTAALGGDGVEVEVTGNSEFTATKPLEKTSCWVQLLPDELTFTATIEWKSVVSVNAVTFNVSDADVSLTAPPATKQFVDVYEAAEWVLKSFHRFDTAIAG